IQKRFVEATSRRESVTIQKNICLLSDELLKKYPKLTVIDEDGEVEERSESVQCTENEQVSVQAKTSEFDQKRVNVVNNGVNVDSNEDSEDVNDIISTQSKEKKSKVEERIHIRGYSESFEEFWKLYPRKVNKSKAKEIWMKIKPEDELLEAIMDSVKRQSMTPAWRKDGGQYVPHATTWLRGKRWEDEVEGSVVVNSEEKANSEIWQKKTEDMVKKFAETGEFW
ncbi:MAG: hypothetical protein KIH03_01640, partial [Paludibacteraceae bacterium]|nr:hypothetical protein [Paludibacteraceae bacterium]